MHPIDDSYDRTTAEQELSPIVVEDDVLREGFTQVPNILLRRTDISHGAKIAYAMLLSYAWGKERCFPGQARLAVDMGVERKAVIRYLNELKDRGIVVVTRRGMGKTNEYRLPRLSDVPKMGHQEVPSPDVPFLGHQEVPSVGHHVVPSMGHKEYTDKNTKKEEDSDTSKFRKAHAKKSRNETGETEATAKPFASDQTISEPVRALQRDLGAASAPDGSNGHLVPVPHETAATTDSVGPSSRSTNRSHMAGGFASIAELLPTPPAREKPPGSREEREIVTAYFKDFVPFLGDEAPLWSSVSQAINIFKAGQIPRERWIDLLLEANAITKEHTGHIQKKPKNPSLGGAAKNRAPYFFTVLRDLCGIREESQSSMQSTG